MAAKTLIAFFLGLLATTVLATTRAPRLGGPEFCNLQRLTTSQPSVRADFEGGFIESWDPNEEQFRCLGVVPIRKTMQPNSLSLPSVRPSPRLAFIEEGEGVIGVHFPGCPETYDTGILQQPQHQQQSRRMGQQGGDVTRDSHQRVQRFRKGDIIAIPGGAVYWCYNDGNQEMKAIIVDDINNPANQLDLTPRTFHLAGGISTQHIQGQQGRRGPTHGQQGQSVVESIFSGFATELLAEVYDSDVQIVKAMQQSADRGLIVKVRQPMEFVTADEQEQQRQQGRPSNGLEEKICSSKILYNLDNQREADIVSRQAGKLNMVNEHKLPILSYLDLAAEKGRLQSNALLSPQWSINSHTIVYVLDGSARVQVVSNSGEAVLDEEVRRGEFFVVPQFFVATAKAGENGLEWVAFKTNRSPMRSPLAGYTSVIRGMPAGVLTNAYDVSPREAQELKTNRETESVLLSPQERNY